MNSNHLNFFTFVLPRDCVMEIFAESTAGTAGVLYCSSGSMLEFDFDSNGNEDFKITYHFEAGKRYYLSVGNDCPTEYTVKFKFIKDFYNNIIDEQYRVIFWGADNQNKYPPV